jgi:acetyl-CoA carboxylase carboxyltransferase component
MGAEGAVNILYRDRLKAASDPNTLRRELTAQYQQKVCDPYTAASQGILDEVIEPVETRRKVIAALEALQDKPFTARQDRHGNMPV